MSTRTSQSTAVAEVRALLVSFFRGLADAAEALPLSSADANVETATRRSKRTAQEMATLSADVVAVIERRPWSLVTDIATDLTRPASELRNVLSKLRKKNRVVQIGRGHGVRYAIPGTMPPQT